MDIPRLFGEVKQLDLPAIASLGGTTAAGSLGLWEPPGLIKTKRDGGRWTVDGGWTVYGGDHWWTPEPQPVSKPVPDPDGVSPNAASHSAAQRIIVFFAYCTVRLVHTYCLFRSPRASNPSLLSSLANHM